MDGPVTKDNVANWAGLLLVETAIVAVFGAVTGGVVGVALLVYSRRKSGWPRRVLTTRRRKTLGLTVGLLICLLTAAGEYRFHHRKPVPSPPVAVRITSPSSPATSPSRKSVFLECMYAKFPYQLPAGRTYVFEPSPTSGGSASGNYFNQYFRDPKASAEPVVGGQVQECRITNYAKEALFGLTFNVAADFRVNRGTEVARISYRVISLIVPRLDPMGGPDFTFIVANNHTTEGYLNVWFPNAGVATTADNRNAEQVDIVTPERQPYVINLDALKQ
jgi:hypothetical protein